MIFYSKALGIKLCGLIAEGWTVSKVCKLTGAPSRNGFYRWLEKHEEFKESFVTALLLHAEHEFDRMTEIAEDGGKDLLKNPDGKYYANMAKLSRDKMRIDVIKYKIAALN